MSARGREADTEGQMNLLVGCDGPRFFTTLGETITKVLEEGERGATSGSVDGCYYYLNGSRYRG